MHGIYSAASAMDSLARRQEMVSQNLANLNTTGYKRGVLASHSFDQALALVETRGGIDTGQGDLVASERRLDLAIDGGGFFAVETPNGERYTRAGRFERGPEGSLVTSEGHRVLGEGGPLTLPDGDVSVAEDGRVFVAGAEIGKLELVDLNGGTPPAPEGNGLYRGTPGQTRAEGRVRQGFLERSNADPVGEMVGMITIQRSFEAAGRAIDTALRTLEKTATELR